MTTLHYMTAPLPIRFRKSTLARLRLRSQAVPGSTPSGLAQRFVEEGLRMEEHPGVVFKNGSTGRRAALSNGPDIWEVVRALREIDERGEDAIAAVAELMDLPAARVRTAIRYYGEFPDEINAEISQNVAEAEAAHEAWQAQRRLLA
ncbi:MAG: hypothetical protein ACRDQW_15775 [Haloechinothrix sp.]